MQKKEGKISSKDAPTGTHAKHGCNGVVKALVHHTDRKCHGVYNCIGRIESLPTCKVSGIVKAA